MNFSGRVSKVQPSATLAITSKAKSMLRNGEDVVILAAGEPDFDTPQQIKTAAKAAIDAGETKYTPSGGANSLKSAIVNKLKRDNGLEYEEDQIIVSCGAKHSLFNIFQVICEESSRVLMIPPYWVSYPEMVRLAGGEPVFVESGAGLRASAEDIVKAISSDVKALILNSPSNPAGIMYTREELEIIGKACCDNGVLMVSDEIYEKIIFDGASHISVASISEEIKDNTMVVNGVSKSHAMTGWRIGYMAGPKEIIKKVNILQSHSTSNPCSISQAAAECALSDELQAVTEDFSASFQKRRDIMYQLIGASEKIVPFNVKGAFYMFCDISATGQDSVTFAKDLLEEKKVAVIPGKPFGRDDHIRISFAASEEDIRRGIARMLEWVDGS